MEEGREGEGGGQTILVVSARWQQQPKSTMGNDVVRAAGYRAEGRGFVSRPDPEVPRQIEVRLNSTHVSAVISLTDVRPAFFLLLQNLRETFSLPSLYRNTFRLLLSRFVQLVIYNDAKPTHEGSLVSKGLAPRSHKRARGS